MVRDIILATILGALAVAATWVSVEDIWESASYVPVPGTYSAKVTSYRVLFRNKTPVVEVQFPSSKAFTFESRKSARFETFEIGQPVRLLQRSYSLDPRLPMIMSYEIDDFFHRFAPTALIGMIGIASALACYLKIQDARKRG